MKAKLNYNLPVCIGVLSLMTVCFSGCADTIRQEMERRDQTVNAEINRIQDKTLTAESRLEEISNLCVELNANLNDHVKNINNRLDGLDKQTRDLNARLDSLSAELDKRDQKTNEKLKVVLDEVLKETQRIIKRIRILEGDTSAEPVQKEERGKSASAGAPAGEYIQHTVKSGENLWSIAQGYGVTMEDIVEANNMESISDIIRPGQVLNIPKK